MTIKTPLIIIPLLLMGCTSAITAKPVPVTSHLRVNDSLDACDKLGQVKVEFEANTRLSQRENRFLAQDLLKQQAYEEYRANNIVIVNTLYREGGYREKNIVSGRGIAYMCYSPKNE